MNEQFIPCPFCKDDDFDLIGLKEHLISGWCDEFNDIEGIDRIRLLRS